MNLKVFCLLSLLAFGGFGRAAESLPSSPYTIPFQGRLTNQQGVPYEKGQYTVVFNIYSQAVGGATKWTERHENVGVTNGMISVFLGSIAPLPTTEGNPPQPFFASARYLGITVDVDENAATADPEMVPRQMIIPAFHAKNADKLASPFGYRDWSSLFGSGKDPATSEILLAKVPELDSAHLPDNIPGTKLAPNAALQNFNANGFGAIGAGGLIFSSIPNNTSLTGAGYQQVGVGQVGEGWMKFPQLPGYLGRYGATMIWTGTEIILWGGQRQNGETVNDGFRFNPSTGGLSLLGSAGAPPARAWHSAVWTGSEMIIWGGESAPDSYVADGGRFNPITGSWTTLTSPLPAAAKTARSYHGAFWTGTEMLVWAGYSLGTLNSGFRYNPTTGTWASIPDSPLQPGRNSGNACWTGTELIFWGGFGSDYYATGARFNPAGAGSWTALPLAPIAARANHIVVWNGTNVMIWGGSGPGGYFHDGAMFNPGTGTDPGSWTLIPSTGAPQGTNAVASAWTGQELIVWGGNDAGTANNPVGTGGRYNPSTNTWVALPATAAPPRSWGRGLWVNGAFYVAAGHRANSEFPNDLWSYTLPRTLYFYQR